jgi:type I restriction enzyme M protein
MNRGKRKATWTPTTPTGKWRPYDLKDILARDKASLDIFWLKDESLEDSANLPDPEVIAQELVEDLEDALAQLREISAGLAPKQT